MKKYARYPYVVVPGPGMYGPGKVNVLTRHRTPQAATKEAARRTRRLRKAMLPQQTSGYFYAAQSSNDYFWADMPLANLENYR